MADVQRRPENVGSILVQVQEDLKHLKEQFNKVSDPSQIDLHSLDDALTRTQEGIKNNTEYVVNVINNEVRMLPTVNKESRKCYRPQVDVESSARPILHSSVYHDSPGENTVFNRESDSEVNMFEDVEEEKLQGMKLEDNVQFHRNLTMKALLNPESLYNRSVLHKNYGFTLPAIKPPRSAKITSQTINKGCTVEPLSVLPKANRVDPSLVPPAIMEKDAKKGILSLIERGLIPPAAELTLDPSPVHHKRALLHHPDVANRKQLHSESSARGEGSHHAASVKLDLSRDDHSTDLLSHRLASSECAVSPSLPPSTANMSFERFQDTKSPQLRSVMIQSPQSRKKSASSYKAVLPVTVFDTPLEPLPPPATPARKEQERQQVVAASKGYSFFMRNGNAPLSGDPEYTAFQQRYLLQWGNIVSTQALLQKILKDYSIHTAYVIGDRLAELASHYEMEKNPSFDELLSVLDNQEEVLNLVRTPGRRYMASDKLHAAALKIQATWRRYRDRKAYLMYRRQRWAAGVIAIAWIMHVRMSRMRRKLREIRHQHIENYRARAKALGADWGRIKNSRRVIIHVPSMGYPAHLRFGLTHFGRMQNTQVARLCDLADPNVDVIYVSPVEVLEEYHQYYNKLLGLRSAVDVGDPEKIGDLSSRFTIIVPDALNKFPTHHMCLASLLKYSPRTVSRIKTLISGRDAYYVPGIMHKDDLAVADTLGIPVIGCEPDICHLYSSKSGSRRVFAAAGVEAPPGEHDVYTAQQLHESLARLICDNPTVKRWLLKIDAGFRGRGIAYVDIDKHLPCYRWMVRESIRYGDKWSKKWAQDAAYTKILCELPETLDNFMVPANRNVFPTWELFLDTFLSQGGIIDAYSPSDSITCLTVTMAIEPNGEICMTSCGDQIHADNLLKSWGVSLPQTSVEPKLLNEACLKIGEACRARGVLGHYSIDFVTFIDRNMKQKLWATDLTLAYGEQMAMTQLLLFVTGGRLDAARCHLTVPPPPKEKPGRFRKREAEPPKPPPNLNRYCVLSTNLYHSNMAVVHYSVFFQMCRAHGIGFDIKERQGTLFTLIDSFKREELGMLTVGVDLPGTLASFARNLTIIHEEISAPNMQGKTNFKSAVDDIEGILGTTELNEKEDEEKEKEKL